MSRSMRSKATRRGSGVGLAVAALATAGLAAGCGSSSKAADPGVTTPAPSVSASTPAASTPAASTPTPSPESTSPAAPAGPATCATASLRLSMLPGNGAAGSTYTAIQFTNTGSATCTLYGYPGVSYVAGNAGTQVGPAAQRTNVIGTGSPATVTLAPGAVAFAALRITDYSAYPPATCSAESVRGFRIYPPGNTAAGFYALPAATKACNGTGILQVQYVQPGDGSAEVDG